MKICDLCGKETTDLTELIDGLKRHNLREVCNGCLKMLDDYRSRVKSVFIAALHEEDKIWWNRLIDNLRAKLKK